jgi:hypothetical protein
VFTGDVGVVSMVAVSDVEEADHSLRHQLIVVQDDTISGAIDTFAPNKEWAGRRWRILIMTSSVMLANPFLLLGGLLYFVYVQ